MRMAWLPVHDLGPTPPLQERRIFVPPVTSLGCAPQWAPPYTHGARPPRASQACWDHPSPHTHMHSGSGVFNTECRGCDRCFTLPAPVPGSFFPGHWFLAWRLADKLCPGLPSEEGNVMCLGDQTMGFLVRQPPFCEEAVFTLGNGWNHLSP